MVYFTYYISNKRVNMENMYSVMYSYKRNYFAVLVRKWKLNTSWTAYGSVKPKSLTVVIIPVPFPVTKRKISLGPKSVFMLWMVRRDVSLLLTDQSGFLTSFAASRWLSRRGLWWSCQDNRRHSSTSISATFDSVISVHSLYDLVWYE